MASRLGIGLGLAGLLALPVASEIRIKRPVQPATDAWQSLPIASRGATALGISFRPPQVAALGLDAHDTLRTLLEYPFAVIRLGAYWNRIEPRLGRVRFRASWIGRSMPADAAGKQIVLCVGALKTFGYPEFFVAGPPPAAAAARRHAASRRNAFPALLAAARRSSERVVERYRGAARDRWPCWQVEHEAVDPLGAGALVALEPRTSLPARVQAVRQADPSRPIMMNGYLPVSLPVRLSQWWQSRDQGDSLDVAQQLADIVGIDYYPRHALAGLAGLTVYLDSSRSLWQAARVRRLFAWARDRSKRLMISEGQAEPWEAVTTPPNPPGQVMSSCGPDHVIANYNRCLRWAHQAEFSLDAYLMWGAEYWILRAQHGDRSYLQAFARILDEA